MKAVTQKVKGETEVVDVPIPDLKEKPTYVRVRVDHVALNPTDWKGLFSRDIPGGLVGCDFAGVVEEVGPQVKAKVTKGDKIAGFVHGLNLLYPQNGAFAEYCLVQDGMFIKVPDALSMKDASTLGVAITTIGQGLYQSLQLPLPTAPATNAFPILVYGGSSAMGTLAIQMAKLSGATVIATASPRNFDLVKSFGADEVFDYNDPTSAQQIRRLTENGLHLVFDCISEGSSLQFCADALSSNSKPENHWSGLLPCKDFPRSNVKTRNTMAYTALGEPTNFGGETRPALKEDWEFGQRFWALSQGLFEQGRLKTHPIDFRSGGLGSIQNGLLDLKDGKVSGKKLVYQVA